MLRPGEMYRFIGLSLAALFIAVFLDDALQPANPINFGIVRIFSFIPFLVLMAAILFILIYLYKSERIAALMTLMMSATVFTVEVLKNIFLRSRPNPVFHNYSFPSGHATFVFALVPFAFMISKKTGYAYLSFALLVSLSRILLKAHFLSDVVAGGILGYSISWIFRELLLEKRGEFDRPARNNSKNKLPA